MNGTSKHFSENLKAARQQRGLTQWELAVKSGFKPAAISHFESGGRLPSMESLRRLADALAVSADYLAGRNSSLAVAGPLATTLARHFSQLSLADQESVVAVAAVLVAKRKGNAV